MADTHTYCRGRRVIATSDTTTSGGIPSQRPYDRGDLGKYEVGRSYEHGDIHQNGLCGGVVEPADDSHDVGIIACQRSSPEDDEKWRDGNELSPSLLLKTPSNVALCDSAPTTPTHTPENESKQSLLPVCPASTREKPSPDAVEEGHTAESLEMPRGVTFALTLTSTVTIPANNTGRKVADRKKRQHRYTQVISRPKKVTSNKHSKVHDGDDVESDSDFEDSCPVHWKRARTDPVKATSKKASKAQDGDVSADADSDFEDSTPANPKHPRNVSTLCDDEANSVVTDEPRANTNSPRPTINLRELLQRHALETTPHTVDLPPTTTWDPPNRTARIPVPDVPDLIPAPWPSTVLLAAQNHNPMGITFSRMEPEKNKCTCQQKKRGECWHKTCDNAKDGVFCDAMCCPWAGNCANGTRQLTRVRLVRIKGTEDLAVQAIDRIDEGVVLGEYLGELTLEPTDVKKRTKNEGYRMHFHSDPDQWGNMDVCVNALTMGTLMRFINHSCKPNVKFNEVGNGTRRTITVVSLKTIYTSEEVTANYGRHRWFTCRCKDCAAEAESEEACEEIRNDST